MPLNLSITNPSYQAALDEILVSSPYFYTTTIGDATNTAFTINHNLNLVPERITWKFFLVSTYEEVLTDCTIINGNTLLVEFQDPPAQDEVRLNMFGWKAGVTNGLYNDPHEIADIPIFNQTARITKAGKICVLTLLGEQYSGTAISMPDGTPILVSTIPVGFRPATNFSTPLVGVNNANVNSGTYGTLDFFTDGEVRLSIDIDVVLSNFWPNINCTWVAQ